jgi:capsular exopolysaccharide synthesis family protein
LEEYEEELSIAELLRIMARRRHWIIWIFLVISIGAAAYIMMKPASYDVSTRIQVDTLRELEDATQAGATVTDLSAELEYLTLRKTVLNALDTLDLSTYEEDLSAVYQEGKALNRFIERIEVGPVENTDLVEIGFSSADPKFAEDFVGALVTSFEQELLETVQSSLVKKETAAQQQHNRVQERYEDIDRQLRSFQLEQNLTQMSASRGLWTDSIPYIQSKLEAIGSGSMDSNPEVIASLIRDVEGLETEIDNYVTAYQELTYLELQRIYVRNMVSENISSDEGIDYSEEKLAQRELESVTASFSRSWENLPEDVRTSIGISDAGTALQSLSWVVLNDIRNRYSENLNQLSQLETEESLLLGDRNRYEGQLRETVEELDIIEQRLNNLTGAVSIISPIQIEQAPTNARMILAVGGLLGLFLGVLAAFLVDMISPAIDHPDILLRTLGRKVRLLGVIPYWRKKTPSSASDLVTRGEESSGVVETYNLVGGTLLFSGESQQHRCFSFSSAGRSEGTSFTVANLGAALAQSGKKVLLVDAVWSERSLSTYFNHDGQGKGLSDIVMEHADWKNVVRQPIKELGNLKFLPFGNATVNRSTVLHHRDFKASIEQLQEQFDVVLIDTPSFISPSDQLAVAQASEGIVLNVRSGVALRSNVLKLVEVLEVTQVPILGVVMNAFYPQKFFSRKQKDDQHLYIAKRAEYNKGLRSTEKQAKIRRKNIAEQVV